MPSEPLNLNQFRWKRRARALRMPALIVVGLLIGGTTGHFLSKVSFDGIIDKIPYLGEPAAGQAQQAQFDICSSRTRYTCVVDGDTIWLEGKKIRIADIDTPEIGRPRCSSEETLGHRAKHRLQALLNEGPFQVVRSGFRNKDKYGRLLRVIERDGRSLGDILVSEGLAHRWAGFKQSWC